MNKKISRCQIKGMLLLLNKIYFKITRQQADYILAEANDIPGLGGKFIYKVNEVVYE